MVIGTGDMSELALGWATYNGDQMSMYGINSSVPKTLVRYMVDWYANNRAEGVLRETLLDVLSLTPDIPVFCLSSEMLTNSFHWFAAL